MEVFKRAMASFPRILIGFVLGTGLLAGATAQEPEELEQRRKLLAHIAEIESDAKGREEAIRAGRERVVLCAHCHGQDGNSTRPEIPNLAGQNPAYLIEQIDKFADGERKNFVMQTLAQDFSFEDKVNLAIYFGSGSAKAEQTDPALARRGEEIYLRMCQFCHGHDGRGEEGYARLAGQKPLYTQDTLKRFRAHAKKRIDDSDVKRSNARMEQVTQNLSDGDIEALAAFIGALN